MQQVKERLGLPQIVSKKGGISALHYVEFHEERTTQGKLMGDITEDPRILRFKVFSVLCRNDGLVVAQRDHQSVQAVKSAKLQGGPWLHFGPSLDATAVGRIKHGVTGEKDLAAWFGEPTLEFLAPDKTLVLVWIEGRLTSSLSHKWEYTSLSVAFDDRDTVGQHSLVETDKLGEAMNGFSFR